ncbi:ribosomal RNA large subunit methyltransferase E-like isoform X2 [Ciona intestinalis]
MTALPKTICKLYNVVTRRIQYRSIHLGQAVGIKKRKIRVGSKNFMEFPIKGTVEYVSRQLSDPFVKMRHLEGYRCRSAYKLIDIVEKHDLLKPGMKVVDLGAAPGSWSQVAAERVINKDDGLVIAVDLLKFPPLDGVTQITGDFTKKETQDEIKSLLGTGENRFVDIVLCDAAPSASGFKNKDHLAIVQIIAAATNFTLKMLANRGNFLFKILDGTETVKIKKFLSLHFMSVASLKPKASRSESAEHFILCKNYNKQINKS